MRLVKQMEAAARECVYQKPMVIFDVPNILREHRSPEELNAFVRNRILSHLPEDSLHKRDIEKGGDNKVTQKFDSICHDAVDFILDRGNRAQSFTHYSLLFFSGKLDPVAKATPTIDEEAIAWHEFLHAYDPATKCFTKDALEPLNQKAFGEKLDTESIQIMIDQQRCELKGDVYSMLEKGKRYGSLGGTSFIAARAKSYIRKRGGNSLTDETFKGFYNIVINAAFDGVKATEDLIQDIASSNWVAVQKTLHTCAVNSSSCPDIANAKAETLTQRIKKQGLQSFSVKELYDLSSLIAKNYTMTEEQVKQTYFLWTHSGVERGKTTEEEALQKFINDHPESLRIGLRKHEEGVKPTRKKRMLALMSKIGMRCGD